MLNAQAPPANASPLAGRPATPDILIDVPDLLAAYYAGVPDYSIAEQRVIFGTSGHRGSPFEHTFNELHVWVISQAICDFRRLRNISGPLFLGMDTHAVSIPALSSALEVLAGNGVNVMLAANDEYTPTPAVSHAVLAYNRGRTAGVADGIVLTPSHNPPDSGGLKYNTPNGGPADIDVTAWIAARANVLMEHGANLVRRMPYAKSLRCSTTRRYDFLNAYVNDLGHVVDMDVLRNSGVRMGVDPLGGAGINYWPAIAERYGLDLTVTNGVVDPAFRFMTVDWDGRIRMDPSSSCVMQNLIGLKDRFDVACACDADHDRHGIVTRSTGLLPPNHYLAVAIDYLFRNRPAWGESVAIGKTVVSTQMIDRVVARLGRKLYEVPVGFKWFVEGLFNGSLGFAGEESAGATFLRRDGCVWTTDKDGMVPALLAGEMTARMKRDPGELYHDLSSEFGECFAGRMEAPATEPQRRRLSKLSPPQLPGTELGGERILSVLSNAPGNNAPIGGLKVITAHGWFAARPSGTENIYKIYAESLRDEQHLRRITAEAQAIVDAALATNTDQD
jgi:phosphoglucomutase